ncbi:MAG: hypothetical protein ACXADY_06030 [Candidatus Hodarchaeales archaeon]|jgi:hypothetical protein
MSQTKIFKNQQTTIRNPVKKTGIEFDFTLLAMMTVFGLELTINQINRNMRSLLVQLKLPIRKNFVSKIRLSLSFLLSNGLVIRRKSGYIISEKGKHLGLRTLLHFRQNVTLFKN